MTHQIVSANRAQDLVHGGEQRLADVEPRETVALEEHHPMPRAGEPGRGD